MRVRRVGEGDRTPRPGKRRGIKRLYCLDRLPVLRVWMTGPKWRRYFGVRQVALADLDPVIAARYHRPGKTVLVFTFEEDVREQVLLGRELRPGVYAEWWDPREDFAPTADQRR